MLPSLREPNTRFGRVAVLVVGLVLSQFVLYAPSLFGSRVLLPLDPLRAPRIYAAASADDRPIDPGDWVLTDAIFQTEPQRRFAVASMRAGRVPLWDPLDYGGAPFLAAGQTAVLSPLRWLDYVWPSPRAIAWREVTKALVAGLGAYAFFRRAFEVRYASALIGAWAWPVCGFLVLWANHNQSSVAIWLPWVLWSCEGALRRPRSGAPVALALATACVLFAGHSGVGAHVLLGSGLWVVGRIVADRDVRRPAACAAVGVGWLLGILVSAPQTLPTLEYMATSARIAQRLHGFVETPPQGIAALGQMVLPYSQGSAGEGMLYLDAGNRLESGAAGYVGLLFAVVFAPLAMGSPRLRKLGLAVALLIVVGVAQSLHLPGFAWLFAQPAFLTLRNHRMMLLAGFGVLALAVLGLDRLVDGFVPPPRVRVALCIAPVGLAAWSFARAVMPPPRLLELLARASPLTESAQVRAAGARLAQVSVEGGLIAAFAAAACWMIGRSRGTIAVALAAVAETVWMAHGANPQRPRADLYPPIPALDAVARGPWGRIACMDACLPASLASNAGLYDVRGYDGADPIRSMQLLDLFRAPGSTSLPHAHAQIFVPKIPSPLADLLGIRWIIARGSAPPDVPTVASSPDYFVVENPRALPRAFVPRGIETVADPRARLARLAAAEFDPRAVALLEVDVPPLAAPAEGDAEVAPTDDSDRLRITARMKTPGALVVSDSWDPGWRAFVGGVERPILRVDHALRAVLLPAGEWTVEMRYEPESFFVGTVVAGGASIALALVALLARIHERRRPGPSLA